METNAKAADKRLANPMTILLTGVAGFIGMHTAIALLARGHRVVGVDDLNAYYTPRLKHDRLAMIGRAAGATQSFEFHHIAIEDEQAMRALANQAPPQAIVHLAAQAGVRHSIENPMAYARANLLGTTVVLEIARAARVDHLVFASSSSVYGGNTEVPYAESQRVDTPVSFYAATKRANEAMAHSYAHLYGIPTTGLRFFTVYGPWGRPDMAPWLFTDAILAGRPIRVFGHGRPQRDFTYVDDIVEGVCRVLEHPPTSGTTALAPWRVLNIGNQTPVSVTHFIDVLERLCGTKAIREPVGMQPGDVEITCADIGALHALTGFQPATPLAEGLARFVEWFRAWHAQPGAAPSAAGTRP